MLLERLQQQAGDSSSLHGMAILSWQEGTVHLPCRFLQWMNAADIHQGFSLQRPEPQLNVHAVKQTAGLVDKNVDKRQDNRRILILTQQYPCEELEESVLPRLLLCTHYSHRTRARWAAAVSSPCCAGGRRAQGE